MDIKEFTKLLNNSYKSRDTEEHIDMYFTRPIGLFFALIWRSLHVHPNVVTIISFFLGGASGWCFYHIDFIYNVWGVIFLLFANFCDSTDGQLARMTGKKTLIGRMLDGFASDVWFFCIYVAIACRLFAQYIPGTELHWYGWSWILCASAGFVAHATQCRFADYYRNIYLFFLLGKNGSEFDSYTNQIIIARKYWKERNLLGSLFFYSYARYCHAQEKGTPEFQHLCKILAKKYGSVDCVPQSFREKFLRRSFPLIKYTNFLTHNWRSFILFAACLLDMPYIYPLFELTIMSAVCYFMRLRHETMCREFAEMEEGDKTCISIY